MRAVFEQTLAAAWGPTTFCFDGAGTLIEVSLRRRRQQGMRGVRPEGAPTAAALEGWLRDYEEGGGQAFPGRWEVPGSTEFRRAVYQAVAAIPPGSTLSYAEVAEQAGSPRAARAVGSAMAQNPIPLVVPCHRVLGSDGIGGFTGGLRLKQDLLACEAR